jgi:hypothetical protein
MIRLSRNHDKQSKAMKVCMASFSFLQIVNQSVKGARSRDVPTYS